MQRECNAASGTSELNGLRLTDARNLYRRFDSAPRLHSVSLRLFAHALPVSRELCLNPAMEIALKLLALLSSGLFAGAAFYITTVEHPARMSAGAAPALQEFRPS